MRISDWSSDVCSSNLLAPDIFVNFHENLLVRETTHARVDQGQLDIIGNRLRKREVRISRHQFHGVPRDNNVTLLFGATVAFKCELGRAVTCKDSTSQFNDRKRKRLNFSHSFAIRMY